MPLLKLFDAGEENTTLFKVIAKNTRQPVQVLGDLRAQVAACRAGEQGITEIVRRYGSDTVHAYTDELQSLGERLMRAEIAALPDGEYSFVDWIDGVGDDPEPLRIEVARADRGRGDLHRLLGDRSAGRREHQLPRGSRLRCVLLRDQGNRGARDPELRGLYAPDSDPRSGGHHREPGPACGLWRTRSRRLPRLRRGDGCARPGDTGPRDRSRRRRPDADRIRGLRGRQALRDDGGDRRHLGRSRGKGRSRRRVQSPCEPVESARGARRGRPAARGRPLRARSGLRRRRALPRRARVRP